MNIPVYNYGAAHHKSPTVLCVRMRRRGLSVGRSMSAQAPLVRRRDLHMYKVEILLLDTFVTV
jgi:hypothetical protein